MIFSRVSLSVLECPEANAFLGNAALQALLFWPHALEVPAALCRQGHANDCWSIYTAMSGGEPLVWAAYVSRSALVPRHTRNDCHQKLLV